MLQLHWLLLCLRVTVIKPGVVHGQLSRQTRNHLDLAVKISNVAEKDVTVDVLIRVQAFQDPFRGELRLSKYSWMMDPTRSREMLICWAVVLVEIRRSIISGVATVLDRPGRGASQMEKSPRLVWITQFLPAAHDGECSVMSLSEWCEFPSAPFKKIKLLTTQVSMLLKSRASPHMLPIRLYKNKRLSIRHMNRPLFPTTLFFLTGK